MILLPIGGLFFGKYIKHPKNVTYIFQVGKSDLVILYSNHQKNVTYIFLRFIFTNLIYKFVYPA